MLNIDVTNSQWGNVRLYATKKKTMVTTVSSVLFPLSYVVIAPLRRHSEAIFIFRVSRVFFVDMGSTWFWLVARFSISFLQVAYASAFLVWYRWERYNYWSVWSMLIIRCNVVGDNKRNNIANWTSNWTGEVLFKRTFVNIGISIQRLERKIIANWIKFKISWHGIVSLWSTCSDWYFTS